MKQHSTDANRRWGTEESEGEGKRNYGTKHTR